MLVRAWRIWTESWRAPRRARLLYAVMTAAFAALAAFAGASGEGAIAGLAAAGALASVALASLAPRLSKWTGTSRSIR